jgi:hypothetical protein
MKGSLQYGISFMFFLITFNFLYGQNFEDVVYLKTGSIIRGIIIEQVPNQSIKVQTKDRNVFVLKYEEIEKITKENLPTNILIKPDPENDYKKSGFINISEVNFCPGIGDVKVGLISVKNNDYSFGLRSINGYQLNHHWTLGIGVGFDKHKNASYIPLTFDVRASILKGVFSPVFNANLGYAIGLNSTEGSIVFNPSIGLKRYIKKDIAYTFNLGMKWIQKEIITGYETTVELPDGNGKKLKENRYFQFITISTGISF